jgi:hypothetical protein
MVLCYVYFVVLFCLLLRVAAHRDMTASSFRASQHRHPLFMQAVRKEVRAMAFCSSLLLLLFTVVPACRLISCVAKSQHPLCGVNFTFKSNKIFIIKGTKQKRERACYAETWTEKIPHASFFGKKVGEGFGFRWSRASPHSHCHSRHCSAIKSSPFLQKRDRACVLCCTIKERAAEQESIRIGSRGAIALVPEQSSDSSSC